MVETHANSIGYTLRAERMRQGKALEVIAAETKIGRAILDAIENDKFEHLPGGAYRRSFIRQYARALRLDEEDALMSFQLQHEDTPVALPSVPKQNPLRHLRGAAYLSLAALGIAGLYKVGADQYSARTKYLIVGQLPGKALETPGKAPETAKAPGTGKVPETGKAPETPHEPAPAPANAAESNPVAPVRAVFTMTEPVWVSVSCDGKPTYTGVLSEKESKSFEASSAVRVLIGNAGGLTITLNGHPVGPIGAHGETQLLELTPNGTRRLPHSQVAPPTTSDAGPEA
jgi:cytoskeleton protein RodZ